MIFTGDTGHSRSVRARWEGVGNLMEKMGRKKDLAKREHDEGGGGVCGILLCGGEEPRRVGGREHIIYYGGWCFARAVSRASASHYTFKVKASKNKLNTPHVEAGSQHILVEWGRPLTWEMLAEM